mgnify:CR=1 FL=1
MPTVNSRNGSPTISAVTLPTKPKTEVAIVVRSARKLDSEDVVV